MSESWIIFQNIRLRPTFAQQPHDELDREPRAANRRLAGEDSRIDSDGSCQVTDASAHIIADIGWIGCRGRLIGCKPRLDRICQAMLYFPVIKSFRHKALADLWNTGSSGKVAAALQDRAKRRLRALHQAARPEDTNISGFNFHPLKGKPVRYSLHVNGPWCITFEWDGTDAVRVDLEQYH